MKPLEKDLETLEDAMRLLFQTMKKPRHWHQVTLRAGVDLDRPAAAILKSLTTCPSPCRVQDLAALLGVEAPSITRKTQALEHEGYLRRVTDQADRRATDLRLTPRGRSVTNRLWKAQGEIIAEALQDWEPEARHTFVTLFHKFGESLAASSLHDHHVAQRGGAHA